MPIMTHIRDNWCRFQGELFPEIRDAVGPLHKDHQRFVMALGIICPENFVLRISQRDGRPLCDRIYLLRAFIAKAIWNIPTTRALFEHLKVDRQMRNLCGWVSPGEIPSESTFSRAFAEFAESDIAGQMHEALVKEFVGDCIVGHVSRDSTAIPAREKPAPKRKSDQKPIKRKRGRPRKGEERSPKVKTRIERQAAGDMTQEQMIDELPKVCDRGAKVNAQGFRNGWIGYKFHIDAIDTGMSVCCLLTSASVHDSQVSIPLSDMTAQRITYLYECMDSAYDVVQIHDHSKKHGRVSIIDTNPRRNKDLKESLARERKAANKAGFIHPTDQRYGERTVVERVNGRLKDDFGARYLRVRGHKKEGFCTCLSVYGMLTGGPSCYNIDPMRRRVIRRASRSRRNMMCDYPKSLPEFQKMFPDDDACANWLFEMRWPDGFECPACGHNECCALKTRKWLYQCRSCRKQTSIRAGTLMQDSKLPLTTWFWAAYLTATHSNGISALQLQKQMALGSYRTAWLLLGKLRAAMVDPDRNLLSGLVEIDETSIRYRTKNDEVRPGRSHEGKLMIAGAVEIKSHDGKTYPGRIRMSEIPDYTAETLHGFVKSEVADGSTVKTDGLPSYNNLEGTDHDKQVVGEQLAHKVLPWVHRIFANLKAWEIGVYHGLRAKHLQSYLDEFVFRFNRRRNRPSGLKSLLGLVMKSKPMTYKMLIGSESCA